ncbi:MAG: peptidylprolyl isomerase [Thermoclostridium sp.]|nr:peptidylprolyl isomerase [Thermoclostridium sp.]
MKKILGLVLAIIVVVGAGCFIWESQSYVARVGTWKIQNHEYMFFLRAQKITTESEAGASDKQKIRELWETPVDGEDPKIIVMNQALENAKEFKVQLIKADQDKFKLSDKDRKELLDYLNKSLQTTENVQYVSNDLGLTLAQFRDMMLKSELVSRYAYDFMQKNRDSVPVTDEEINAYYQQNRDTIDSVTVSHLLISTQQEGITATQRQEKKQLADSLFQRIEQGENMATLIRDYSADISTKDNSGLYSFNYVDLGAGLEYTDVFGDWAFDSAIGDLELIESQYGYHIVRLEDKSSLEDKKEMVRSTIQAQKMNDIYYQQVQEWNKDPQFNLIKNEEVLDRITRKSFPEN